MGTLFLLWLCTILASVAFSITPFIALIKEIGENGYKINVDKFSNLFKFYDMEEQKVDEIITILLYLMPIINIIFSFFQASEYITKKSQIIEEIRCSDAFEEMTEEEKLKYNKSKKISLVFTSENEIDNVLLKVTLDKFGFTINNNECNGYFCINNKLENKEIREDEKILYTDEDLTVSSEDTKVYTNALVNLSKGNLNINIGYFIENHKAYKVYEDKPFKINTYMNFLKFSLYDYDNDKLESAKEECVFPVIKNNVISISTDFNEDIIVDSNTFFEELSKLGYDIDQDNLDFNKLINKLLLNDDFGLDIELTKSDDKTKKKQL